MSLPASSGMFRELIESSLGRTERAALAFAGRRWTFGEVLDAVARTSDGLAAQGIGRGMRAAVALPNIPEAVYLVYALSRRGATAVMLHPLSAEGEISDSLAKADCRIAFCLPGDEEKFAVVPGMTIVSVSPAASLSPALRLFFGFRERWSSGNRRRPPGPPSSGGASGRARRMTWPAFLRQGREAPESRYEGDTSDEDIALILGSGGTGGAPKLVLLSNRAVSSLARSVQSLNRSGDNDGILCLMPFFHGFGLCFCLHAGLLGGKKCVLLPRYSDRGFAHALLREKPAYLVGVPAMYERMLANPRIRRARLDFILGAACGGDVMSERAHREISGFLAGLGCACGIQMGYGLTECVTACAFTPENSYREGRIGKPFPGIRMKIASDARGALPPLTPGEIWIAGPTLMSGYLGDPAGTADALQRDDDGRLWLRTGDIGFLDEEVYFRFLERSKRVIKRAGYNVFPREVEAALEAHPEVLHAHVVVARGTGDETQGADAGLTAFVQTRSGREGLERELLEHCAKTLNPFHRPSRVVRLDEWPLTRMRKVDVPALERMAGSIGPRASPRSRRPGRFGLFERLIRGAGSKYGHDFAKYLFVGIVYTLVNIFLMWLFIDLLKTGTVVGSSLAVAIIFLTKYGFYVRVGFLAEGGWLRYALVTGMISLLNVFLMWLLVDVFRVPTVPASTVIVYSLFVLRFLSFYAAGLVRHG